MKTGKILQGLAGFIVAVSPIAQAGAAQCVDDTPITGSGFFSASCNINGAEGEAIGSSNQNTGFIQADLFSGDSTARAFGSLRDATGLVCIIEDAEADGSAENRQSTDCAGATLVRVTVVD
jgi:hypothetical protein